MSIGSVASQRFMQTMMKLRAQADRLQDQIGTGMKAHTYAGLGAGRTTSLAMRQRLVATEAFEGTITTVEMRIKLMDTTLTRLGKIPAEIRGVLDPAAYEPRSDGYTDVQRSARISLDEAITLLNADIDGRHLYAGDKTDVEPVVNARAMLDGEGSKAGLRQLIAERRAADLGLPVGGQVLGRLTTGAAGPLVTVGKADPANNVFGFEVVGATTTGAITVAAAADGTPQESATFDLTGPLAGGESVRLTLKNPKGPDSVIELKATVGPEVKKGEFLIDADPNVTAANFQQALRDGIEEKAQSQLWAASAAQAADDFFDTAGGFARRIDLSSGGGTAATATAYRAAGTDTSADTVQWYRGQNDPIDPTDLETSPRRDATAEVDRGLEVAYGARANEEGLRMVVQNLTLFVADTFPPTTNTAADAVPRARYAAFGQLVRNGLTFDASEGPEDVHAQVAIAGKTVDTMRQRNATTKATLQGVISDVEGVDKETVAAQLLSITNTLEASYAVTAKLSELSLVNFVR